MPFLTHLSNNQQCQGTEGQWTLVPKYGNMTYCHHVPVGSSQSLYRLSNCLSLSGVCAPIGRDRSRNVAAVYKFSSCVQISHTHTHITDPYRTLLQCTSSAPVYKYHTHTHHRPVQNHICTSAMDWYYDPLYYIPSPKWPILHREGHQTLLYHTIPLLHEKLLIHYHSSSSSTNHWFHINHWFHNKMQTYINHLITC